MLETYNIARPSYKSHSPTQVSLTIIRDPYHLYFGNFPAATATFMGGGGTLGEVREENKCHHGGCKMAATGAFLSLLHVESSLAQIDLCHGYSCPDKTCNALGVYTAHVIEKHSAYHGIY